RDGHVTGVQTCALPILGRLAPRRTGEHQLAAPHHSKAASFRARRALPPIPVVAQKQLPKAGPVALRCGARRARASAKSAPSNTRLKLAARGSWGKLSFVTNQAKRRSLSAGR